jgi:hypothetical protein
MRMNTNIPMMGQPVNVLRSLTEGLGAADMQNQMTRQRDMEQLFRTQGPGIMAGEQNALNALAQFDPMAGIGVQDARLGLDARRLDMDATRQRMSVLDQQSRMEIQRYAAGLSAAEAAAKAAETESAVKFGLALPDEMTWDREMAQRAPGLVGRFAQRDALANQFLEVADILKQRQGPEQTSGIREYEFARGQGFAGSFEDWKRGMQPPGTNVNVNTAENTSVFQKKADETAATRLGSVVEAGQSAQQFMGDMQALATLAGRIGTGQAAQITAQLGPWAEMVGVNIEGLSDLQAFEAIKDRLVPQMRPPGSGAASDFDARQFLSSLPSLSRTPEGNRIITDTLQAMYQHRIAAAQIANEAFRGQISWQDADRAIADLGNPFETFNQSRAAITGDPTAQPTQGRPAAEPGAVPPSFVQKYRDIAEREGISIEDLWEAWPNKGAEQ